MIAFRTVIIVAFIAFVLAGCSSRYSRLGAEERVRVGRSVTVEPQIEWNRRGGANVETWTVDGPALQRLVFLMGIPSRKTIVPLERTRGRPDLPVFDGRMTALEVRDLFTATMVWIGHYQVDTRDLRPTEFGGQAGFRFEFGYVTKDGLEMSGFAAGAIVERKLYLVYYVGAAVHYFDAHKGQAEQVVASLTFDPAP